MQPVDGHYYLTGYFLGTSALIVIWGAISHRKAVKRSKMGRHWTFKAIDEHYPRPVVKFKKR